MLNDDCTEYIEGEWVRPTHDSEPWAIVTKTSDGWAWLAMDEVGNAPTIDDARAQAVAALERFAAKRVEGG